MRIKSFFAASVEQAIQEARQELGPDAMLITSRRSSPEARSLGAYEVVFGLQAASATRPSARPERRSASRRPVRRTAKPARAVAGNQKHAARRAIAGASPRRTPTSCSSRLVSLDLSRNMAREVVSAAARLRDQLSRERSPRRALPLAKPTPRELVARRLRFAPPFYQEAPSAGPCDRLCRSRRRRQNHHAWSKSRFAKACPIANRPHPLGGPLPGRRARKAAQLRRHYRRRIHARSIPCRSSLERWRSPATKAWCWSTLPDTAHRKSMAPGKSRAACERIPNKQVHLVLPASMKRGVLTRCLRDYADFQPDCLLFTKLDETGSHGEPFFPRRWRRTKPLSFFAGGQNIPEDLEPANAPALLASVFRREAAEAVSAA